MGFATGPGRSAAMTPTAIKSRIAPFDPQPSAEKLKAEALADEQTGDGRPED